MDNRSRTWGCAVELLFSSAFNGTVSRAVSPFVISTDRLRRNGSIFDHQTNIFRPSPNSFNEMAQTLKIWCQPANEKEPFVPNVRRHTRIRSFLPGVKVRIPRGFRELLYSFAQEVLRVQPTNINLFAVEHFAALLTKRRRGQTSARTFQISVSTNRSFIQSLQTWRRKTPHGLQNCCPEMMNTNVNGQRTTFKPGSRKRSCGPEWKWFLCHAVPVLSMEQRNWSFRNSQQKHTNDFLPDFYKSTNKITLQNFFSFCGCCYRRNTDYSAFGNLLNWCGYFLAGSPGFWVNGWSSRLILVWYRRLALESGSKTSDHMAFPKQGIAFVTTSGISAGSLKKMPFKNSWGIKMAGTIIKYTQGRARNTARKPV